MVSRTVRGGVVADSLQRENAIRESLDDTLAFLETVEALSLASDVVSDDEFQTFTQPLLRWKRAIQALGWNPLIRFEDRDAHEASIRVPRVVRLRFEPRRSALMHRRWSRLESSVSWSRATM